MLNQNRKWASLRAYIFAPINVQFPTSRALHKRIRSSLRHNIPTLFYIVLVLSLLASPFSQPSLAAAPTSTHNPIIGGNNKSTANTNIPANKPTNTPPSVTNTTNTTNASKFKPHVPNVPSTHIDYFRNRPTTMSDCVGHSDGAPLVDGSDSTSCGGNGGAYVNGTTIHLAQPTRITGLRIYQHANPNDGYVIFRGVILFAKIAGVFTPVCSFASMTWGNNVIDCSANTATSDYYQVQLNDESSPVRDPEVFTYEGYSDTPISDAKPYESYGGGNGVTPDTTCNTCNPVNIATGNFWHSFTDISIPGRSFPLEFSRTYNEQLSNVTGTLTTTMGYGWNHSYNWFMDHDASNDFLVHEGNGSVVSFYADLTAPARVMATLTTSSGNYTFSPTHGLDKYYFEPMPGVSNAYRLYQIVDRAGLTTTLSYYTNTSFINLLHTVTDPASRQLSFSYTLTNTTPFLTGVSDNGSRSI